MADGKEIVESRMEEADGGAEGGRERRVQQNLGSRMRWDNTA